MLTPRLAAYGLQAHKKLTSMEPAMELFTLTDMALIGLAWAAYAVGGIYFFAWKPKHRAVQLTRLRSPRSQA